MIRCNHCGSINKDTARYCKDCGAPLNGGTDRPDGRYDNFHGYGKDRGKNYAYDGGGDPLPPPPAPKNPHDPGPGHGYPDNSFREPDEDEGKGKVFNRIIMAALAVLVIGALAVASFVIVRSLTDRGGKSDKEASKEETDTRGHGKTDTKANKNTKSEEENTKGSSQETSTGDYDEISIHENKEDNNKDNQGNAKEDTDGQDNNENDDSEDNQQESDEDPYAGFIFPDSHERYLSESEASGLSSDDAQMAINEIYARRGWDFKKEKYKKHFSQYSWYHPVSRDEGDMHFNEYEKANIKLLSKYR